MKSDTCEFCRREGQPGCRVMAPPRFWKRLKFICTRPEGHDGPHVACGGPRWHEVLTWERTEGDERLEETP